MQKENSLVTEELTDLKFENIQLHKAIEEIRNKVQESSPVVDQVQVRCDQLEREYADNFTELQNMKAQFRETLKQNAKLKNIVIAHEKSQARGEAEFTQLTERLNALRSLNSQLSRKKGDGAISTRPPFLTGAFNQTFEEPTTETGENKKPTLGPKQTSLSSIMFDKQTRSVILEDHEYQDLEVESVLSLQPEKLDLNMLRL